MTVYHNTRKEEYRTPYGAVKTGTEICLSLDVFEVEDVKCVCRLWTDGKGETLVFMSPSPMEAGTRFSCRLNLTEPDIVWYHFIISCGGREYRYGAKEGRYGGEGKLYEHEPPSFQITVYNEKKVPDWYKSGIVYQIFPDRFSRGEDWRKRAEKSLKAARNGPARALCSDWYDMPEYEKDAAGRVTRWDFYGGTLSGIRERLPYLKKLGVSILYLNPVFEAASNHRYDIGDYMKIDPMLGDDREFRRLCGEAEKLGISVILDGVFNHTGCDSRYFNKYGNYEELGAFQSKDSEYRDWYHIEEDGYGSWWGVDDLPDIDEDCPSYRDFIYRGKGSVVRRWLRMGARGWRLDVADELPDDFIAGVKGAAVSTKEDSVLIGEVWEDASNKISYGKLRRYLLGDELDSVMNYPLRDALLRFILGEIPSWELCERLESLKENYPPEAFYSTLNMMGSHDRVRLMTILGEAPEEHTLTEKERAGYRLQSWQRNLAKSRLWLTALCQMTLPGVPCIYYGDEAGLEGYSDPGNRAAFPWGREDADAGTIYKNAISLRKQLSLFVEGDFSPFCGDEEVFGFIRRSGDESAVVLINRSLSQPHTVRFPSLGEEATELVAGQRVTIEGEEAYVTLPPMGSAVVYFHKKVRFGKALERGTGVLCHITSLPNRAGAGTLDGSAESFLDALGRTGQKYWQILPVNPTDEHGSPYAGISAFAGNTELADTAQGTLEEQFKNFIPDDDFRAFCEKNKDWLDKYAVFMALQDKLNGARWQKWPDEYRRFSVELVNAPEISEGADFYRFGQYVFDKQWQKVHNYAGKNGIMIIGDMPMYVSEDSADAWAEPELFCLDEDNRTRLYAGVPPDRFSEDGQSWGLPVYDWDEMKKRGFSWWLRRLERAFELYDYVRLDHFRGFEACWAIPAGKKATEGYWLSVPGAELFIAAKKKFGILPILAEDLGNITPGVRALMAKCGFTGMNVMQFYDGDPLMGYYPPADKVVYTGTHDNRTLRGWCEDRYPDKDADKTAEELMLSALESEADAVIFPLQDLLGLGDEARMNTPGTVGKNWKWQADETDISAAEKRLSDIEKLTKRSRKT